MSANNIVQVDFKTQLVYEIAAIVLVSLLYSEPRDTDDDRSHALSVLCARAVDEVLPYNSAHGYPDQNRRVRGGAGLRGDGERSRRGDEGG